MSRNAIRGDFLAYLKVVGSATPRTNLWQQGRTEEGRLSCLTPKFPAFHPNNGKTIFLGHVVGPSYRCLTPTPFMLHKTSADIIGRSSQRRLKTVCQIVQALDVGRRTMDGDETSTIGG